MYRLEHMMRYYIRAWVRWMDWIKNKSTSQVDVAIFKYIWSSGTHLLTWINMEPSMD